jgi:phosphate:Na+ symporter
MSGTELLVHLAGGIALLLWAVRMVRTGLMRAFGGPLRRALAAGGRSRLGAFAAGLGVTALLQSSTATALIISSFAGRRLIALPVALAMMLGAGIGSTVAAQVLAFDLSAFSPALIAIGVAAFMSSNADRVRHLGRISIGIGLLLLSLELIQAAAAPLRDSAGMSVVLHALEGEPWLALLIAAALTWAAHASLAMVLFIMSLAAVGTTSMPLALALILGANVGTAITPLVDQWNGAPEAKRVSLGNIAIRCAVALALLPFLSRINELIGMVDTDAARAVIHFHSAYNIVVAAIGLPLVGALAALATRLVPVAPRSEDPATPRYLDAGALDSPSEALAAAARETLHLGDLVSDMLANTIVVFTKDDAKLAKSVEQADDAVDRLHEAIKLYLIQLSRGEMSLEESARFVEILTFVTNLEHVGDIIDKNLMELAAKKIKHRYAFSPEGRAELVGFHTRVMETMQLALNVFMTRDPNLARRLLAEKSEVRDAELAAAQSHFGRLKEGRPESLETSSIHLDVIRDLKRINGHLTSVAYPILEATGELAPTRLKAPEPANGTEAANGRAEPGGQAAPAPHA